MTRFVRILKRIGKGILVLIGVLLVALLITRWVFVRQLNAEIAEIKARGEPLTEAEMAGPPVPDSENAALVYTKAIRSLPAERNFWSDMESVDTAMKRGDGKSLQDAARLMKAYARAAALTRHAASMPRCRFSTKDDGLYPKSMDSRLRRLCLLLSRDATLSARTGRTDNARSSLAAILNATGVTYRRGDLSSALSQEGLALIACRTLEDVAAHTDLSQRQVHELFMRLSGVDVEAMHKRGFQGERAYSLSIDHSDSATWKRERGLPVGFWEALWAHTDPVSLVWRHVIVVGDATAAIRYYEKLIGSDYGNYGQALAVQRQAEEDIPFYAVLTGMSGAVDAYSLKTMFHVEARVKGSQVFLALLAYHDRHKAYPTSLAELRKDPGWAIPKDPFNGKDFIYGRKGSGFLLYSVGPDLKDNGGRPQPKGKAYRANAEYDIQWQMTR